MTSPDSLATIRYDITLEVLEFRLIVSIATIVGNRCKSVSAFLPMKSYKWEKYETETERSGLGWIAQCRKLTCCSSSGKEISFCDIMVNSFSRILFKLFTNSGIRSDFSNGS